MRQTGIPGSAVLIAAVIAIAALLAGCGAGDSGEGATSGGTTAGLRDDTAAQTPAVAGHIHAVGIDPGDDAAMIATHHGLFRLGPGADNPERVGDLMHDLMGFTVTGPGRYLASGHPDPRSDLPAHLGLIASDDGGSSWSSVSLTGQADFHALAASGSRIAAVDSITGGLFLSADAGATWERRPPPAPLLAVAIDPTRPETLVAATSAGIAESRDAGLTWSEPGGEPGYLAWPATDALYRVTADGGITVSADRGRTWSARGTLGETPAALSASDRDVLLAATHDGRVVASDDGGATWRTLTRMG